MDNQTHEKLEKMNLRGMARAYKNSVELNTQSTPDEFVAHLVDAEWDDRYNRKLTRLIKAAGFRYKVTFEDLDFSLNRNLDKNQMLRFSNCQWIERHQNIILTGQSGVGKSFIVSALGHQACVYGFKTRYYSCSTLFNQLKMSRIDGSYLKEISAVQKFEVFILDDFGIEVFDTKSRLSLLEIIEDRHGRKSTVIVSQLPVNKWHDTIGDATIGDAICDRIIHTAHRIDLKGESVRKLYARKDPA